MESDRLEWQPITPENLPKVGDEVLAPACEGLNDVSVMGVTEDMIESENDVESWRDNGWTHFRAINPPSLAGDKEQR